MVPKTARNSFRAHRNPFFLIGHQGAVSLDVRKGLPLYQNRPGLWCLVVWPCFFVPHHNALPEECCGSALCLLQFPQDHMNLDQLSSRSRNTSGLYSPRVFQGSHPYQILHNHDYPPNSACWSRPKKSTSCCRWWCTDKTGTEICMKMLLCVVTARQWSNSWCGKLLKACVGTWSDRSTCISMQPEGSKCTQSMISVKPHNHVR